MISRSAVAALCSLFFFLYLLLCVGHVRFLVSDRTCTGVKTAKCCLFAAISSFSFLPSRICSSASVARLLPKDSPFSSSVCTEVSKLCLLSPLMLCLGAVMLRLWGSQKVSILPALFGECPGCNTSSNDDCALLCSSFRGEGESSGVGLACSLWAWEPKGASSSASESVSKSIQLVCRSEVMSDQSQILNLRSFWIGSLWPGLHWTLFPTSQNTLRANNSQIWLTITCRGCGLCCCKSNLKVGSTMFMIWKSWETRIWWIAALLLRRRGTLPQGWLSASSTNAWETHEEIVLDISSVRRCLNNDVLWNFSKVLEAAWKTHKRN